MEKSKIACKLIGVLVLVGLALPNQVYANLTKEQSEDVALFATTLIEKGNERRDENGYPLMVYALSNSAKICKDIRLSGYEERLYYINNNNYHKKNGKYLDLGLKWCMDCGDFISYVYKTTLGLDMLLEEEQDPWHIKDIYADAKKGEESEYFYFVYQNVPISSLDESKLEKGDIVLRLGSRENHGLIYVGENMQTAHASRNGIHYGQNPVILGFEVVTLNRFYKSSTIVSIARVKDGVIPETQKVNGVITWPDTGEEEDLLASQRETAELQKAIQLASLAMPFLEYVPEDEIEEKRIQYFSFTKKSLGTQEKQEFTSDWCDGKYYTKLIFHLFWYKNFFPYGIIR